MAWHTAANNGAMCLHGCFGKAVTPRRLGVTPRLAVYPSKWHTEWRTVTKSRAQAGTQRELNERHGFARRLTGQSSPHWGTQPSVGEPPHPVSRTPRRINCDTSCHKLLRIT